MISPPVSAKVGTKVDYTCKELRGKTKGGENERGSLGADGASAPQCCSTTAQLSGKSVSYTQGSR